MSSADIAVHRDGARAVVVAVSGEIDLALHDLLLDTLQSAVKVADVEGVGGVEVDLSHTSFMDSTGIRVLMDGYSAAAAAGVGFSVTGVSGLIRKVLEITGVLSVLTGQRPA